MDCPKNWLKFLPWVEYCFNTSCHTSVKMIHFEALYGREPLKVLDYIRGQRLVGVMDVELRA